MEATTQSLRIGGACAFWGDSALGGDRSVEKAERVAQGILARTRRMFAQRGLPDYEALAGGGAASLRNDPLGKTFGQVLLAFELEVPEAWLD